VSANTTPQLKPRKVSSWPAPGLSKESAARVGVVDVLVMLELMGDRWMTSLEKKKNFFLRQR
jgi:hypothetical protein